MLCPQCGKKIPKESTFCMHCGALVMLPDIDGHFSTPSASGKCRKCGCKLPASSLSDLCAACLLDTDFSADIIPLDTPPQKRRPPRWILFLMIAVVALAGILLVIPPLLEFIGGFSNASQESSEEEHFAATYAHEMVRDAAYAPASVHFKDSTLHIKQGDKQYTITQSFERDTAAEQAVPSVYTVILTLNEDPSSGYTPLLLQIDDDVILDHR